MIIHLLINNKNIILQSKILKDKDLLMIFIKILSKMSSKPHLILTKNKLKCNLCLQLKIFINQSFKRAHLTLTISNTNHLITLMFIILLNK